MRRIPLPIWGFALLLALLTSLPYIAGALNTPQGWVYSGAPGLPAGARVDYNSHLAKMWQGLRGQWDYHLLFTHETHPGIPLLQGFYIGLGALAALTPFGLVAVYHIARFLLTLAMLIALWVFACRYFEKRSERWLPLLLATLAGGWSWLLLAVPGQTANVSPIEFWLLDAFNLLGALTMPHFAAAVILQIVVVLSFESWLEKGQKSSLLLLTLALLAEAIVQPYIVLLIGPLLAIWSAYQVLLLKSVRLRRALWLILPLGLHALVILYHFSAINADPIWSDFSAQNKTLSPPPLFYLLGYLPLLLPALLGLRHLWQAERHWRLLLLWLLLAALLLYFPLPTQRRYLLGLQTPLALLAAFGWTRVVLPRLRAGYRQVLSAIYVLLASVSLIGVLLASIAVVQNPAESACMPARMKRWRMPGCDVKPIPGTSF